MNPFPLLTSVALGSVAVLSITVWIRDLRCGPASPQTASAAAALLALITIPWALGDGGIPWISFGGSASIAAFVLTGMVVRADRMSSAVQAKS